MGGPSRNAKCPCGSGRKYKACCLNGVRPGYIGRVILQDEVELILKDYPKASALYEEVVAFFGEQLVLRRQEPGTLNSGFVMPPDWGNGSRLPYATIFLAETEREAASLAHELLHLAIRARGFPTVSGLSNDDKTWVPLFGLVIQMVEAFSNFIDHETFYPEFLAMGFPGASFVAGSEFMSIAAVEEGFESRIGHGAGAHHMSGLWGMYFTNELLANLSVDSNERISDLRKIGQRLFAMDNEYESFIVEWIKSRGFAHKSTRANSIRSLMSHLGMVQPILSVVILDGGKFNKIEV